MIGNTLTLTTAEVEQIIQWKETHIDDVRKMYQPVSEISITVEGNTEQTIKCYRKEYRVTFYYWQNRTKLGKLTIQIIGTGYRILSNNIDMTIALDIVSLYFSIMALMVIGSEGNDEDELFVEKAEALPEDIKESEESSPRSSPPKRQNCYSYIVRHRSHASQGGNLPKRSYTPCEKSFTVRGHYRHYKNKTIWINEYKKGDQPGKKQKRYKLGNIDSLC